MLQNYKNQKCPCTSGKLFSDCCEPFLMNNKNPTTALELMRSRFSAYVTLQIDFLVASTHISTINNHRKSELLDWAKSNIWQKLEIISFSDTTVEFKAYYLDQKSKPQIHHEFSVFKLESEKWYYVNGRYL